MDTDVIPGFAPAIVTNVEDPLGGGGRIKVKIPGLIEPETAYWVMPMCWPGGGRGDNKGSQYPAPPVGSQVAVMFEYGKYLEPDSHAVYLTGFYGVSNDDGGYAGPAAVGEAPTEARARDRTVIWEGEKVRVYIIEDATANDYRLLIESKLSGSKIELNAADGENNKSETINIEARTQLTLYSRGIIDIQADGAVQIQGRVVDDITTRGI